MLQNDYLRQLGGLRGRVPALILASESCLQPLAFMWLRSCTKYWNHFILCGDGLLRRAFVGDLRLTTSLSLDLESPGGRRCRACRTWLGAWLRVLHWLSLAGGPSGSYIRRYLDRVMAGLRRDSPKPRGSPVDPAWVLDACSTPFPHTPPRLRKPLMSLVTSWARRTPKRLTR